MTNPNDKDEKKGGLNEIKLAGHAVVPSDGKHTVCPTCKRPFGRALNLAGGPMIEGTAVELQDDHDPVRPGCDQPLELRGQDVVKGLKFDPEPSLKTMLKMTIAHAMGIVVGGVTIAVINSEKAKESFAIKTKAAKEFFEKLPPLW